MYVAEGLPPTAPSESMRLNSTRQLKKEWSQTPKCQPHCRPPFSFKGSNAFVRKETCYKCGSCTTTKIERLTPSPEQIAACPHANLNRSGSTRTVSRLYCKDGMTYVSEEPQTEATRAASKAPPPRLPGSWSGYSPPVPERRNVAVPIDQMMLVVTTFKGLAIKTAAHVTIAKRSGASALRAEAVELNCAGLSAPPRRKPGAQPLYINKK